MGWMNDMLRYFSLDPLFRKGNHSILTFSMFYAFSENYILPLSHDEVVHGKCSLIGKMSGSYEQKFANLRAFYAFMMAHPGKKLLFMGGEFAQFSEWQYDNQLDWNILEFDIHNKFFAYVRILNNFYKSEKALWQNDHDWHGFRWINTSDAEKSIISFVRISNSGREKIIVVCNFTPNFRPAYTIGVPVKGVYEEIFNTDDVLFGGTGKTNPKKISTEKLESDGFENRLTLALPPLSVIFLKKMKGMKRTKSTKRTKRTQST
jgi:1,4-alpha-glucan branching enzyme